MKTTTTTKMINTELKEIAEILAGIAEGKEWEYKIGPGQWLSGKEVNPLLFCAAEYEMRIKPEPEPDPYAEFKAAHAAGKTIQVNCGDADKPDWTDLPNPYWTSSPEEYRVKPEPKFVPLEWDDIKAGDEFRYEDSSVRHQWLSVGPLTIRFWYMEKTYQNLMDQGWQIRSIGETEWRPCWKEVQG